MKLKSKFLLYSILTHLAFIILLSRVLYIDRYLFVAGEGLLIISLITSIWLYKGISSPLKLITFGIASIKEKEFNSRLNKVGHPEMDELISIYNLMIDQLRVERVKYGEKNYLLDKLVQSSPFGIILLDADHVVKSANPAASQMLGLQFDLVGLNLKDINGKFIDELNDLQDSAPKVITYSGSHIYKCQKTRFVDKGYSHYFIMLEELTREVYLNEKKAYEKVIRMMSHETNNSIAAINSILKVVINYKDQLIPQYRADYENAISVAINRNNSLSAMMSNFAKVLKIPEPRKEKIDLHEILKSVQILMNHEAQTKDIEWDWQLGAMNSIVNIDVQQIEQALINILKNSIEAIGEKGKIIIRTADNPLRLSLIDNGIGITKEINQQLFSAFFSTKKNGQGIGLTLTREILFNHNLNFYLGTAQGWTAFEIQFPSSVKA